MLANNLKQLELQKPRMLAQTPSGEDISSSEAPFPRRRIIKIKNLYEDFSKERFNADEICFKERNEGGDAMRYVNNTGRILDLNDLNNQLFKDVDLNALKTAVKNVRNSVKKVKSDFEDKLKKALIKSLLML